MNARRHGLVALFFLATLNAGCGARLYKVAPLPSAPPKISAEDPAGLGVGIKPVDEDQSLDQFEANLYLAGVIAVEAILVNRSPETIKGKKIKFELRDASGRKLKQLSPKKALDRVMGYYDLSFYRKDARTRTREDYQEISLDTDQPLAPQEERRGYVFFKSNTDPGKLGPLSLTVKGGKTPVNLQFEMPSTQ